MAELTLAQIRNKVKLDLDLEEELFITDTGLNSFINAAIRDVEAKIHTLYEDYFLSTANISLVSGTSEYAMPSDIYADKIRLIQYNDGATKYDIPRVRNLSDIPFLDTTDLYSYLIINTAASGRKIKFYPASRVTSATAVTIFYIRIAKELTSDSHTCDLPTSFINYVHWRTKLSAYQQEGSPMIQEAQKEVDMLMQDMVTTLSNRIPDDDNKVLLDTNFYSDME